jgi:hypothetical protein
MLVLMRQSGDQLITKETQSLTARASGTASPDSRTQTPLMQDLGIARVLRAPDSLWSKGGVKRCVDIRNPSE